ncbi:hypothetical protein EOL94_00725 [bacterium]|nr:hypothetical protein [bacterium]
MTLKKYLTLMVFLTLVCWFSFVFVIKTINPDITNFLGFVLFYATLFLASSGTAAILGFLVRFLALKQKLVFSAVHIAFRQAFLFGVLIVVCLMLLSNGLFNWLNLSLVILVLLLLEVFLINNHKNIYEK